MKCPKCESPEKELDYWIDGAGDWHWTCFECGYTWQVSSKEMKKDIEKKE